MTRFLKDTKLSAKKSAPGTLFKKEFTSLGILQKRLPFTVFTRGQISWNSLIVRVDRAGA